MIRSGMSPPRWEPLEEPLGSHESLPVLWLDGVCDQIRRLSHRVEADESSDQVCYGLDRVVKRKASLPRSHVERERAAIRIHRAKGARSHCYCCLDPIPPT